MYGFIMACIELYDTGQSSVTLKSKDLATHGFHKKIPDTRTQSQAQFQKSQPTPCKPTCAFLCSPLG